MLAGILSSVIDGGVTALKELLVRIANAVPNKGLAFLVHALLVSALILTSVALISVFAPGAAGTCIVSLFYIQHLSLFLL